MNTYSSLLSRTLELLRSLGGLPGPALIDSRRAFSKVLSIVTFNYTGTRPLTFENVYSGRWALDNRREFGSTSATGTASPLTPSQGITKDSTQASGWSLLVREAGFKV
jgi:hypothetical protein